VHVAVFDAFKELHRIMPKLEFYDFDCDSVRHYRQMRVGIAHILLVVDQALKEIKGK
jgi:hypothetical protein